MGASILTSFLGPRQMPLMPRALHLSYFSVAMQRIGPCMFVHCSSPALHAYTEAYWTTQDFISHMIFGSRMISSEFGRFHLRAIAWIYMHLSIPSLLATTLRCTASRYLLLQH